MTRSTWLLVAAAVFAAIAAAALYPRDEMVAVAHALGGIEGKAYTNSKEAFELNYKQGFRVFEVDLQETADGQLVARHDWEANLYRYLEQDPPGTPGPLTYAQARAQKINKRYTLLHIDDLMAMMKARSDAVLVTDTKETESATVRRQFKAIVSAARQVDEKILARIIPQIYRQEMLADVESVFPFETYIYTLYASPDTNDQVISFLKDAHKVKIVTMPKARATGDFVRRIKDSGRRAYAHTSNDLGEVKLLRNKGVNGIYTDFLTPEAVRVD